MAEPLGVPSAGGDPRLSPVAPAPSSSCDPSVVVRAIAATDPLGYATFVINLPETRHGRIADP